MQDGVDLPSVLDRLVDWFDRLPPNLGATIADVITVAGVAAVCGGALFLMWREIMTSRSLRPDHRRRYIVRSTGTHEWSREELARWGAHLAMIRRRVRRMQDRPAQAVRFRLSATPHGVTYMIEGSWRIEKIMRNPLLPGVTVTHVRLRSQPDAPGPDSEATPTTPTRS